MGNIDKEQVTPPDEGGEARTDISAQVSAPQKRRGKHPLLPGVKDISFVTFRKRVNDRIEHCPTDFLPEDIRTWMDVVTWMGGGEYQAVAKNEDHEIIAYYPSKDEWMFFPPEWCVPSTRTPTPTPKLATDPITPWSHQFLLALGQLLVRAIEEFEALRAVILQKYPPPPAIHKGQC